MIDTSLFPYETFPIRLEYGEKKNPTVCYFQCKEHLQKHVEKYKLDKRTIKIDYRDEKPVRSRKRNKGSVEQNTKSKNTRGSSTVRTRKSSVDTNGNSSGNSKRKKQ